MTQRIKFIIGGGAVVSAAPRLQTAQSVTSAPTSSARRSAAQPKTKTPKQKR
jgi:hypothetical protein